MRNTWLRSALLLSISMLSSINAQAQHAATIPAGTVMHVSTIDPIDINSAKPGVKFRGSLADPVMNKDGAVLIPRGAPVQLRAVTVEKSKRIKGRDKIDLKVDSITFNGRTHPVASSIFESKGDKKGKRALTGTGIGAGAGAAIGAIAGGGTGAAVGALIGGGGGTAVAAATGDKHLSIPSESVLSFQLQAPLQVR
jgi:hypothetical protein